MNTFFFFFVLRLKARLASALCACVARGHVGDGVKE